MNDEVNGKKKPTTDQRRAMAQLAESIFAKDVQEARDEEGALVQEITGIESSKAGRLLKGRIAKRSSSVRDLEKRRKEVLTGIWTCETVDQLNEIADDL